MRQVFIKCGAYGTAKRRCPWSAVIARVEGGFVCFESVMDYKTWRNQK